MRHLTIVLLSLMTIFAGCERNDDKDFAPKDRSYEASGGSSSSSDPSSGSSNNPNNPQNEKDEPGVITAGEWNDLANWDFWKDLMTRSKIKNKKNDWKFYPSPRVSVKVTGPNGEGASDVRVKLTKSGSTEFVTRTDNKGKAELWPNLFTNNKQVNLSNYQISVGTNGKKKADIKAYDDGINQFTLETNPNPTKVDVAFAVDATGSMGDELKFLQTELKDVISRAENASINAQIATSALFYRDEGDDYLTKKSDFASNVKNTINFIKKQNAGGGGDYEEAVHTAMKESVFDLSWSESAKSRILFLLLDAPPHKNSDNIQSLQNSIEKANKKGIRLVPIVASGIDKETEFLMRSFAISTNGTYVFITDHSGVGGDHIEATVGDYEVEYLNDLMVRLIKEYAK